MLLHDASLPRPIKIAALDVTPEAALRSPIGFSPSRNLPNSSSSRHVLEFGFLPVAGTSSLLFLEATRCSKAFPTFSTYRQ